MSQVKYTLNVVALVLLTLVVEVEANNHPNHPKKPAKLESPSQRWAPEGPGGTPEFTRHIVPLFGKLGCNNRACHGSFQGQNGFHLSLFGFEPESDHRELLEESDGFPRADRDSPDDSLVLLKPSRQEPHKGGKRMEKGGWEYRMFRQWIIDGAPYDPEKASRIERFEILPPEVVISRPAQKIALQTVAYYSDGTREDVTALTVFSSNDEGTAAVSPDGEISAVRTGDTSIVALYGGGVASTQVLVPFSGDGKNELTPFPPYPPNNRIDELVVAKLRKLNTRPSELSTDDEFLRRVTIDVIGTLPTAEEARRFLSERDPDKRSRLIDALLQRPEYALYWGMKFSDWTGNGSYISQDPTKQNWMWQLWLEDKLSRNLPYDELVRGFICATSLEGRPREEFLAEAEEVLDRNGGRGNFDDGRYARRETLDLYWIKVQHRDPATVALQSANAFLGLRLECAQCHNHPFDRWTQDDYEGFKSFFMFGRFCKPETGEEITGRSRRGYGFESVEPGVRYRFKSAVKKTPPKLLGGAVVPHGGESEDPLTTLWKWMRAPENEFFSAALVNRIWGHYFGVGIVEPADDFTQGNPPTNPQLLKWLASDFIEHGFDLKHVHRRILNSRTYQLSWKPNPSNRLDTSNFSHALLRRMPAEVLMDALAQVTGVPDDYGRAPVGMGSRAVGQASPPVRYSLRRKGYAMTVFGRPGREKTCDCERSNEPSVAQALYLINDDEINLKIADRNGRLRELLQNEPDDAKLVEELYLSALSRYPGNEELGQHLEHVLGAASREEGFQDVLWTLLNVREFVFLR